MVSDGEDGNGLRYGFLKKKRQDACFSNVQVWLENTDCELQETAFNRLVRANEVLIT